jgi:hypothetical protein
MRKNQRRCSNGGQLPKIDQFPNADDCQNAFVRLVQGNETKSTNKVIQKSRGVG